MQRAADIARGRWRGILPAFGIPSTFLDGKQHPCPICGGKDRARFDDKEGRGTWYCNRCGAGDGLKLVELKTGLPFADVAKRVEELAGSARAEKPRKPRSEDEYHEAMTRAWLSAQAVTAGDPVDLWLRSRVGDVVVPPTIRYAERCFCSDDRTYRPAMLAKMHDPAGVAVMVHRTFLTMDGRKADVPSVRMTMPGHMPPGSAVRLAKPGAVLGIAEGIETAFAASKLFGFPVWAALNATMLEKWVPPASVERVVICGDHDASFAGQAAAFALAKRLSAKPGLEAEVRLPGSSVDRATVGWDWNDALRHNRPYREYGTRESDEGEAA